MISRACPTPVTTTWSIHSFAARRVSPGRTPIVVPPAAFAPRAAAGIALRMRTMEQFPNFGEVDDLANFEEIQRGLGCLEDEWVYMHRGLGIPGRVKTDANGIITAPATDEAFMREYIREWKRLMKAEPNIAIKREP